MVHFIDKGLGLEDYISDCSIATSLSLSFIGSNHWATYDIFTT